MHLSLLKWFPLFILASSGCWSLQCLISALTQGGDGGHFFRLSCSVVKWGGRNTANKYHWCVWGVFCNVSGALDLPPLTACVLSWSTLLRLHPGCSAGELSKAALGCMHFPGLSHSGSGSRVLHKSTDSVGPVFCALPRSEQLRQKGAWQAHSPHVRQCAYLLPCPSCSVSWVHSGSAVCLL